MPGSDNHICETCGNPTDVGARLVALETWRGEVESQIGKLHTDFHDLRQTVMVFIPKEISYWMGPVYDALGIPESKRPKLPKVDLSKANI